MNIQTKNNSEQGYKDAFYNSYFRLDAFFFIKIYN